MQNAPPLHSVQLLLIDETSMTIRIVVETIMTVTIKMMTTTLMTTTMND